MGVASVHYNFKIELCLYVEIDMAFPQEIPQQKKGHFNMLSAVETKKFE